MNLTRIHKKNYLRYRIGRGLTTKDPKNTIKVNAENKKVWWKLWLPWW
jgi:hypothetical protein